MTALVALLSAQPVAAGALSFTLKDGRVTILAYNVTVREILDAWEHIGRVTIIRGDQLAGTPVTVELRDMPEAKALDVLLRSVSGYVAVSRSQPVSVGSIFQSITILPTSRAPSLPPPVMADLVPRAPVSTVFVPPSVTPVTTAFTPAAGVAAPRVVPVIPVEQSEQALHDFLARGKSGNSNPAPTSATPGMSTGASRPGSITPYTPPANTRPASPPVPRP